jgi:hypothetical protein
VDELSLHLLDLVENSLSAGAGLVVVEIEEDRENDLLTLEVIDDGAGMDPAMAARADDPFVTTRTTRRVGLGLSLLRANALNCEGDLKLESRPGRGTRVKAWFRLSHIDRQPLGDWPSTLMGLVLTRPGVEFVYRHRAGGDEFELDTRLLREELGDGALEDPGVIRLLGEQVAQALKQMGSVA